METGVCHSGRQRPSARARACNNILCPQDNNARCAHNGRARDPTTAVVVITSYTHSTKRGEGAPPAKRYIKNDIRNLCGNVKGGNDGDDGDGDDGDDYDYDRTEVYPGAIIRRQ